MIKLVVVVFSLMSGTSLMAQRNLFSSLWNEEALEKVLVQAWQPFPRYENRSAWDSVPRKDSIRLLSDAWKLLGKPYEFLPISEYLGFVRDGNRNRYEKICFDRRSRLLQVLIAECIEGKGRFRDDIINGIWTICEESSWCIPAHIGQSDGVPDLEKPVVDLFAAETAALLAWTNYLYGSELDSISPLLRKRLMNEIQHRILKPFLERNDFWWMGFGSESESVNNWNPWILSNILPVALLIEENRTVQLEIIAKALRSLDNFTNAYPPDGGCDEGPSYWGRAGGSLFDCLETLYSASGGKINYYGGQLVKNIGQYIYKAHIQAPWYINFADASPQIKPDAWVIYNYGKRIGDDMLSSFGARLDSGVPFTVSGRLQSIGRSLPHLFALKEIRSAPGSWPYLRDAWLPDLQVAAARSKAGSPEGLFFAAKGGHNAESHNHNDVGTFIVYYDGQPVLIDAGVGAYTAKTFSRERYIIWSMQSQYHNLPTVNGFMQEPGRNYAARNPSYASDDNQVKFSLGLAACYPAAAGIEKWDRSFAFSRGDKLVVTDDFRLREVKGITSWNFVTCLKPEIKENGMVILRSNALYNTSRELRILYPGREMNAVIEEIILAPEDGFQWGANLHRIVFTPKEMPLNGMVRFTIENSEK